MCSRNGVENHLTLKNEIVFIENSEQLSVLSLKKNSQLQIYLALIILFYEIASSTDRTKYNYV